MSFLQNSFLEKSVAKHFEDCHSSPKNLLESLSKLGNTSLFYGEILQSLCHRGRVDRGREGQNPGAASPSAKLCEHFLWVSREGSRQKDHPFPFHQTISLGCCCSATWDSGDDGPDVLVYVGGGVAHRAQKASTCSRKLATATIPPTLKSAQWRGFPAKSNNPFQPPTQIIHWVRRCEQKDVATARTPLLPRLYQLCSEKETPPSWARKLSGFVYGNWPSLSSYSQGGVLPGKECQVQRGILQGWLQLH